MKKSDRDHLARPLAGAGALRFFSIAEVADQIGVCSRTVRRWIDQELLVAHRVGAVVRIADEDLRAFLATHRGA